MSDDNKTHFTDQALLAFHHSQGKKLKSVICHLFINTIRKDDVVQIIDNVRLVFEDGTMLTIGTDENVNGLDVVDFSLENAIAAIPADLREQLKLLPVNASDTSMWKDLKGAMLKGIRLSREGEKYLSDALVLDFGDEKREIRVSPLDGLIIDFYED